TAFWIPLIGSHLLEEVGLGEHTFETTVATMQIAHDDQLVLTLWFRGGHVHVAVKKVRTGRKLSDSLLSRQLSTPQSALLLQDGHVSVQQLSVALDLRFLSDGVA